jgi:predicted alpha/beta-fold hydrolase
MNCTQVRANGPSMRLTILPLLGCSLLLGACGSLKPLPEAKVVPCTEAGRSLPSLWAALRGIPVPDVTKSGFSSTVRVVSGDLARKDRDQRPGDACGGDVPVGFELLQGVETGKGVPPLHALYKAPAAGKPIVILVHGLYDSKFSQYILVTAIALARDGFGVLAPDMRWHGCLLTSEWLPTLGVAEATDLAAWARHLRATVPGHAVALLGFSLGGLDVLHAAALPAAPEVFDGGAVAVCPPATLERTLQALDSPSSFADHGFNSIVHSKFSGYLKARLTALAVPVEPKTSFMALLGWLASQFHSPGPDPAGSFLDRADPIDGFKKVRTPLLVLVAADDPIIPDSSNYILQRASRQNEHIGVIETKHGGHLGQVAVYPEWFVTVLETFFRCAGSGA